MRNFQFYLEASWNRKKFLDTFVFPVTQEIKARIEQMAYQHKGVESNSLGITRVCSGSVRKDSDGPFGQYHGTVLHQEARRDTLLPSVRH